MSVNYPYAINIYIQRGRGSQVPPGRHALGQRQGPPARKQWDSDETNDNFDSAAFWRRAREKTNIQNNTRKYDSMTSAQYEHRYCMKCGESNHDTTNCFHKEAIECSDCHRFGHKSKWCRYYNWRSAKVAVVNFVMLKLLASSLKNRILVFCRAITNVWH